MPRRPRDRSVRRNRCVGALGPLVAPVLVALLVGAAAACEPSGESAGPTSVPTTTTTAVGPDTTTDAERGAGEPTDPTDPAPIDSSLPGSGIVTGGTTVSHTAGTRAGGHGGDIRDIDFADLTFPTTACAGVIDRPPVGGYHLVDGEAHAGDPADDDAYAVTLNPELSFGDVNGDAVTDAALVLDCARGSRPVPVGWVYTLDGAGRPEPLAQVALDPDALPLSGVLDTGLDHLRIEGSSVLTDWVIYLDGDALCCPTKTATVRWTWTDGALNAGAPVVARTAATTGG